MSSWRCTWSMRNLFRDHLLLRLVGRNLVRLFGQGPLLTNLRVVLGLLDLEIARGLGLSGLGSRLGDNALLVCRGLGNSRLAHGHRAADSRVALSLGCGDVGLTLDPSDIRATMLLM